MAKKILKGVGGILGLGKKRKAAAPVEQSGPVVTPLGGLPGAKKATGPGFRGAAAAQLTPTILSDKLGN